MIMHQKLKMRQFMENLHLAAIALVLSAVMGVFLWISRPDQKAFSWLETRNQTLYVKVPFGKPDSKVSAVNTANLLKDVKKKVKGNYHAFAVYTAMGNRVQLADGQNFPITDAFFVSGDYLPARRVGLATGRMYAEKAAVREHVIGAKLAIKWFGSAQAAVNQAIWISTPEGEEKTRGRIVGVLTPSPGQDPVVDPDPALISGFAPEMQTQSWFYRTIPAQLAFRIHDPTQVDDLKVQLTAWAKQLYGPEASVQDIDQASGSNNLVLMGQKARQRGDILRLFESLAFLAAALALVAQRHLKVMEALRVRGIEKALGASRPVLLKGQWFSGLPAALLGSLAGASSLWILPVLLPQVFLGTPRWEHVVQVVFLPVVLVLVLNIVGSWPLLRWSSHQLLCHRPSLAFLRSMLLVSHAGIALSIAVVLSSQAAQQRVATEARQLQNLYGQLTVMQTGSTLIDTRQERLFETSAFERVFDQQNAQEVQNLSGMDQAVAVQHVPAQKLFGIHDVTVRMVVTDQPLVYLNLLQLGLSVGNATGCLLVPDLAQRLQIRVGDVVRLLGVSVPVPCQVTGLLDPPTEMQKWLAPDLPQLVVPPLQGLKLPGTPAQELRKAASFSAMRLLVKGDAHTEQTLKAWLKQHPAVRAEVLPYTPNVQRLVSTLRVQSQAFAVVATLSALVGMVALVGGFFALLHAEHQKMALNRALGLTLHRQFLLWLGREMALATLGVALATVVAWWMAQKIHQALALDVPGFPGGEVSIPIALPLMYMVMLYVLIFVMVIRAKTTLTHTSILTALKEGHA